MKKTVFLDDLTGDEASTSVTFAVDDKMYEIDLSDENAQEFRDTMDRYIRAAREKLMQDQSEKRSRRESTTQSNSREIRKWARKQGYEVKGFGRIPYEVVRQFENSRGGDIPRRRASDQAA